MVHKFSSLGFVSRQMSKLLGAFLLVLLVGCVYRIDVQQGNVISREQMEQVKTGMTRDQVRFALGTPLLVDPFHERRWDFVYSLRKGSSQEHEQRRLSIHFDPEGKVQQIDADAAMQAVPADATGGARVYDLSGPAKSFEAK